MKNRLLVFTFAIMLVGGLAPAQAASIVDGHWEGGLTRGGSVQVVAFDFVSSATGSITGHYDIPELGLYDEPVKTATLSGSQLTLNFLYGTFTMTVHQDVADMTGVDLGWHPAVDLHLKQIAAVRTFRADAMRVRCGSVIIAGTLYRPLGDANVPLLIIVPGSDDRGRASWEYRGYGPMLAQQGVAAFVYDKRDIGESSKSNAKTSLQDYALDASALVDGLRQAHGVDPQRVGLAGASQGGWIAPMAAALNKHVAFTILLSGPAVSVERQELDRVAATMRERDASADDLEAARKITQAYFDVAYGRAPMSVLKTQVDWLAQNQPKWADVLSGPDPGESLADAVLDWKRIRYDPASTLRATRIPLLAFFGTSDDMVLTADNAPLMTDLVGKNNPRNRVITIAGANHALFMGQSLHGTQWSWPDQYWIWDRRAPDLIPTMVSWIRSLPSAT